VKTLVAMFGALVLVAAAGNARADAAKDMQQKQTACADISNLHASINNMNQLGPDATLAQVKESEERVRTDYQSVTKSSSKVAKPQTENLKASIDNLKRTVEKMPDTMTVSQAKTAVSGAMNQVKVAGHQLETALGCEGMEAPAPNP
jgi:hypothetical protein